MANAANQILFQYRGKHSVYYFQKNDDLLTILKGRLGDLRGQIPITEIDRHYQVDPPLDLARKIQGLVDRGFRPRVIAPGNATFSVPGPRNQGVTRENLKSVLHSGLLSQDPLPPNGQVPTWPICRIDRVDGQDFITIDTVSHPCVILNNGKLIVRAGPDHYQNTNRKNTLFLHNPIGNLAAQNSFLPFNEKLYIKKLLKITEQQFLVIGTRNLKESIFEASDCQATLINVNAQNGLVMAEEPFNGIVHAGDNGQSVYIRCQERDVVIDEKPLDGGSYIKFCDKQPVLENFRFVRIDSWKWIIGIDDKNLRILRVIGTQNVVRDIPHPLEAIPTVSFEAGLIKLSHADRYYVCDPKDIQQGFIQLPSQPYPGTIKERFLGPDNKQILVTNLRLFRFNIYSTPQGGLPFDLHLADLLSAKILKNGWVLALNHEHRLSIIDVFGDNQLIKDYENVECVSTLANNCIAIQTRDARILFYRLHHYDGVNELHFLRVCNVSADGGYHRLQKFPNFYPLPPNCAPAPVIEKFYELAHGILVRTAPTTHQFISWKDLLSPKSQTENASLRERNIRNLQNLSRTFLRHNDPIGNFINNHNQVLDCNTINVQNPNLQHAIDYLKEGLYDESRGIFGNAENHFETALQRTASSEVYSPIAQYYARKSKLSGLLAYAYLAQKQMSEDKFEDALRSLDRCLALSPDNNRNIKFYIAEIKFSLGLYEQAKLHYIELLGLADETNNDPIQRSAILKRMIDIEPYNASHYRQASGEANLRDPHARGASAHMLLRGAQKISEINLKPVEELYLEAIRLNALTRRQFIIFQPYMQFLLKQGRHTECIDWLLNYVADNNLPDQANRRFHQAGLPQINPANRDQGPMLQ
ncbi:MAG: tetratricopeptide repeat protein [Chlamydiales bacterium]|nr:tetratricopeptide repeat protein [Chlamydiales bacterium]